MPPATVSADDLQRLTPPNMCSELVRGVLVVREPPPAGFAELAPDLVVEVLSPNDRPGEVLAKVADWLNAGSALVWVLDPVQRRARVYRADGSESFVGGDGVLEGEDVLPGLTFRLASLW